MNILLTGGSGFIGTNLKQIMSDYNFSSLKRGEELSIKNANVVIHLAGISKDSKKISDSSLYYEVNTNLTKNLFDAFLISNASIFIFISSVKAVADNCGVVLTENVIPKPLTYYGKSKLLAEQYIRSKEIPKGKKVFILRPTLIYGSSNNGNLKLLFNLIIRGIPWPLGAFDNQRSICFIENLIFVIKELITNDSIDSGIYNVCDDDVLSTNDIVKIMANSLGKPIKFINIPKFIIKTIFYFGDILRLPVNNEILQKLTLSFVVSNEKIVNAMGKKMPFSSRQGLEKTLNEFKLI
jgi:nucleoside-diphosphate-sugar epimerase